MPIKFTLNHQCLKDDKGNPVSEIQLFKLGKFEHWSGSEFVVDEDFIDSMIANFEALKSTSKDGKVIPMDYNHGSLSYGADEAKAAGWITELIKKDDGLYCHAEWTEEAAEYIKKGEYRYVSPEFSIDTKDEYGNEIEGGFLYAAALTNRPFLKGMEPVALAAFEKRVHDFATRMFNQRGEEPMKEKLAKLLALKEATEDAVLKAVESVQSRFADIVKVLALKDGEDPVTKIGLLVKESTELNERVNKLSADLKEIAGKHVLAEATQKVEKLIAAGKAVPAEREALIALATEAPKHFDAVTASRPVITALKDFHGDGNSDQGKSDDLDKAIAAHQAANKCDYLTAYRAVTANQPELAEKHARRAPARRAQAN